jgi:anthranilate synthase component 2
VCLGMQALIEHFGGRLRNLDQPLHGVARVVQKVAPCPMLGVSEEIKVGHYHSWVADEVDWPEVFEVTARGENMIMAMRHKSLPITGVQFHPESVLTPDGRGMLKRWLGSLQH